MAGNKVQVGSDSKLRVKTNAEGHDGIVIAGDDDPCCCDLVYPLTPCSDTEGHSHETVYANKADVDACAFASTKTFYISYENWCYSLPYPLPDAIILPVGGRVFSLPCETDDACDACVFEVHSDGGSDIHGGPFGWGRWSGSGLLASLDRTYTINGVTTTDPTQGPGTAIDAGSGFFNDTGNTSTYTFTWTTVLTSFTPTMDAWSWPAKAAVSNVGCKPICVTITQDFGGASPTVTTYTLEPGQVQAGIQFYAFGAHLDPITGLPVGDAYVVKFEVTCGRCA